MTATAIHSKAVENLSYTLGASLVDDEVASNSKKNSAAAQDFWGSSMSFDAVREGRIFGAFGVARKDSAGRYLARAMA